MIRSVPDARENFHTDWRVRHFSIADKFQRIFGAVDRTDRVQKMEMVSNNQQRSFFWKALRSEDLVVDQDFRQ